jgi:hypothetical protein
VGKAALLFDVLIIITVILASITINISPVRAEGDYSIGQIFHTVKIMHNGYVFINDTCELNNMTGAPNDFLMGFPDKYGPSVLKCVAFSGSDTFKVTLDTPLNGHMGFYGVKIDFPIVAPQVFTVGFVLSNSLLTQNPQNTSSFELDFPAYPSLLKKADFCNVSVIVPAGASFISGTPSAVSGFAYGQQDLKELTRLPATLDFQLAGQNLQIVDIAKLNRVITVNGVGEMQGADTYEITNEAPIDLAALQVFLPPNASSPETKDLFGRSLPASNLINSSTNHYEVDFTLNVTSGNFSKFVITYSLPGVQIMQGSSNFALNLSLFEHEDYYVDEAFVTIVLPEGARINGLEYNLALDTYNMERSIFQETATLSQKNFIVLNTVNLGITYEYNSFWASFRPTLWAWTVAVAGCVVLTVTRRRPRGPSRIPISATMLKLGPDFLKSFVDMYEEKKKIDLELGSLETRVEKGRVPRRRYKVMRKTLEMRLDAVSRKLAESKERIRATGGKYSGLMLQLEVAEAEIGEVKANIKNSESLHNRGELSLEAYRNRLSDYQRKKERAETTINGILLRLREEIK